MTRHSGPSSARQPAPDSLTYGEYFEVVESFLVDNVDKTVSARIASTEQLEVHLEKHGAFYHPSRIVEPNENRKAQYVLNVAASTIGKAYLRNEFRILQMLEKKYAYPFLPRVFACRETAISESRSVSLFLGEWFESHHEFHVSKIKQTGSSGIRLWDPANDHCFLSIDEARSAFRQAAMILTACYDVETFEQVFAWHHAAGDFVVNLSANREPLVKLVTVRRYAPLVVAANDDSEAMLDALLLFLFNMSMHMRIDRLDGVGELCWIDDFVVPATLEGFYKGLALQHLNRRIPEKFAGYFRSYLAKMTAGDMLDLFASMAARQPPDSPDTPLVASHAERHAEAFFNAVRTVD
ncbi:MAG: hypothetical protein LJE94_09725 [Deltaproteobacteria bacterium]|nr:hypothetical protein [Deltaproteobacteria bacterium]